MESKTEGLVIRTTHYQENDKIVTLLTPSRGKVTAFMKGVKKPTAKLNFASQPFAFCEYVLAEKGGRNTVVSAYLYDGFYALRTDVVRYYSACVIAEVCDALVIYDEGQEGFFIAAIEALKALTLTEEDPVETVTTFLLVALREGGYMLDASGCADCGGEVGKTPYFDFSTGQFTCPSCARGVRASESTYEWLKRCQGLSHDEEKSERGKKRALRLMKEYIKEKTEGEYPCLSELIRLIED